MESVEEPIQLDKWDVYGRILMYYSLCKQISFVSNRPRGMAAWNLCTSIHLFRKMYQLYTTCVQMGQRSGMK